MYSNLVPNAPVAPGDDRFPTRGSSCAWYHGALDRHGDDPKIPRARGRGSAGKFHRSQFLESTLSVEIFSMIGELLLTGSEILRTKPRKGCKSKKKNVCK